MEKEYLAIMATWKRSSHLSQSVVGFAVKSFQNTGNPTICDNEVVEEDEFSAHSAMVTNSN